jgi:hypothetical protein
MGLEKVSWSRRKILNPRIGPQTPHNPHFAVVISSTRNPVYAKLKLSPSGPRAVVLSVPEPSAELRGNSDAASPGAKP